MRAQTADMGFDPQVDGTIHAFVVQPDGRIIIGGSFDHVQPFGVGESVFVGHIARLEPDGTVDLTFKPFFNGDVTTLALQSDGGVLVGGRFTTVHEVLTPGSSPVPRNGLARINTDGSLDETFDPHADGTSYYPGALIRAIAVQPDGDILIGGAFNSLQPHGQGTPVVRNRIARLNADGTVDAAFDPNANNLVLAIAVQTDGRILIGGGFTRLQPNGAVAATDRSRLARLQADGTLDATYDPRPDNRVTALVVEADGSALVAGNFLSFRPAGSANATAIRFLARIRPDGSLDTGFLPGPNAAVESIAVQYDGKIVISGQFGWLQRNNTGAITYRDFCVRLNRDASIDSSFSSITDAAPRMVGVQPDGRVLIAGEFTRIGSKGRFSLARFQLDGAVEDGFVPASSSGRVTALAAEPGGTVLVAGGFTSYAGATRRRLARIGIDGLLDRDFQPRFNGDISDVLVQPDGRILVAGAFTTVNGTERNFLARLETDGTLDPDFDPKPNGRVYEVVLQSDGKILAGGAFTKVSPNGATQATDRAYLARFNANGTLDTAFYPNPSNEVYALLVLSDGRIVVGGTFTSFEPNDAGTITNRYYLGRLTSAGELDTAFNPIANYHVYDIVAQSDGKLIVGGAFTAFRPEGASETSVRNYLARLTAEGAIDTGFDPGASRAVTNIAVAPDGKVLVCGGFSEFFPNKAEDGIARRGFAWLNADGTVDSNRLTEANGSANAVLIQGTDNVFVGGEFTAFREANGDGIVTPDHLVRLHMDGSAEDAFVTRVAPGTGGEVSAIALQVDGRVFAAGDFSDLAGNANRNLLRTLADGMVDSSFIASTDEPVRAMVHFEGEDGDAETAAAGWLTADGLARPDFDLSAISQLSGQVLAAVVQSDGKLVLGGTFSSSASSTQSYLTRLNVDGTVDSSFNPGLNGGVRTIALEPDGQMLIGGYFTKVGATDRNHIARLNANGTLDAAFDPRANDTVYSVQLLSDGRIVLGGEFTTLQPNGAATATTRRFLARIGSDGALDTGFSPQANGLIYVISVLAGDQILIGGDFTTIQSTGDSTAVTHSGIARIDSSGRLDVSFDAAANNTVAVITPVSGGSILIGGTFTVITDLGDEADAADDQTTLCAYMARLAADGSVDAAFNPRPDGQVLGIGLQSDGRIIVGGGFTGFTPSSTNTNVRRNNLARLNPDGTVEPAFNPSPNNLVNTLTVRPDNSIVIGGAFTELNPGPVLLVGGEFATANDNPTGPLAALFPDGGTDNSFRPAANGHVLALASQSDGRILVGGAFTSLFGQARNRLARLEPDLALDDGFNPGVDGTVDAIAIQSGGGILVGGSFTTVAGGARRNIARLDSAGALDGAFNGDADGRVTAIVAQPNGRILIAGEFAQVGGAARPFLARLLSSGAVDSSFNPAPNGAVRTVALRADGRIVVGGAFTQIGGGNRARIARLNADGSLDATYVNEVDGDISAVAIQPDGRAVIGGAFGRVNGQSRYLLARLPDAGSISSTASVSADLTSFTWMRTGSAPEVESVVFGYSTDGAAFTDLGVPTRTGAAGVWSLGGLNLPANSTFYIRADGALPTSSHSSSGRFRTVWQFHGTRMAGPVFAGAGAGIPGGDGNGDGDGTDNGSGGGSGSTGGGGGTGGTGDGTGSDGSGASGPRHLINLSIRARPGDISPLIAGFVIGGTEPQQVVLRAIGPTLADFGVEGFMAQPRLILFSGTGQVLESVETWGGSEVMTAAFDSVGAFPLDPASADAALVTTLQPGAYSFHVSAVTAPNGIALGEIYTADSASGGGLANLSTLAPVGSGAATAITGFVVDGTEPVRLLVRAAGPALLGYDVTDAVPDPAVFLFNAAGDVIAANDDWGTPEAPNAQDIATATSAAGAFEFAAGSRDAALVIEVQPGAYSVHVVSEESGRALGEVYELP